MLHMGDHDDLPFGRHVVLGQQVHQGIGKPLRNGDQEPGTHTNSLHMVDLAEVPQKCIQPPIAHHQGIPAGDQHLLDSRLVPDPGQRRLQRLLGCLGVGIEHLMYLPISLTVNTYLRTGIIRLQDHDLRITPGDQVDGRGVMFAHVVGEEPALLFVFDHPIHIALWGDNLSSDGVIVATAGIGFHQREIKGCDAEGKSVRTGPSDLSLLPRRQLHQGSQGLLVSDHVPQMPSPIVPVFFLTLKIAQNSLSVASAFSDHLRI